MIRAAIALVVVVALLASCAGPALDHAPRAPGGSVPGGAPSSASTAVAAAATPAPAPSAGSRGATPIEKPHALSPSPAGTAEQRAAATPARGGPTPDASPGKAMAPGTAPRSPGASLGATPIEASGPGQLVGVLGFDAVEGGCLYVETAPGTRFELLLPAAWRMDPAAGRVAGPAGALVSVGQRVSVTGAVTDAIATVCQVGPVFRVTGIAPVG